MNTLLVIAVVGLIAGSVSARGVLDGFRSHGCQCRTNTCAKNTGAASKECYGSRVQYYQCQGTTCSVADCPADSLFNETSGSCDACAAGFHVDQYNRTCVCNEGTTFSFASKSCVACPKNAVVTADHCGCENTVLDKTNNECKDCPAGSKKVGRSCECTDETQFWNAAAFACQGCPGVWQNVTEKIGNRRFSKTIVFEICNCTGTNQYFDRVSVSCVTCPTNSTAFSGIEGGSCKCAGQKMIYDAKTNACVSWTAKNPVHGFFEGGNGH